MKQLFIFFLVVLFSACASKKVQKENLGFQGEKVIPRGEYHANIVFEELMADPKVVLKHTQGWKIASKIIGRKKTTWTFPPVDHPAYPSVVKRVFSRIDGLLDIKTSIHCGASKSICDDFVREFIKVNRQLKMQENGYIRDLNQS
ncbi:MAG: hypothetical protein OXE99_01165 [Cellvibrionales bacterium]|nr:hypothetical protein [Cellvibrionales bacterium]